MLTLLLKNKKLVLGAVFGIFQLVSLVLHSTAPEAARYFDRLAPLILAPTLSESLGDGSTDFTDSADSKEGKESKK